MKCSALKFEGWIVDPTKMGDSVKECKEHTAHYFATPEKLEEGLKILKGDMTEGSKIGGIAFPFTSPDEWMLTGNAKYQGVELSF